MPHTGMHTASSTYIASMPILTTSVFMQAGNYAAAKPFLLPALTGFSTAISAADVKGLRATTISIAGCTNSMLLSGVVKDTRLEVALQAFINNGFVSDASTLQNVDLYSGFLTYTSPGGQVAAAHFKRAPSTLTNTRITYTAIDGSKWSGERTHFPFACSQPACSPGLDLSLHCLPLVRARYMNRRLGTQQCYLSAGAVPTPGSNFNPNFAFVRNGAADGSAVANLGFTVESW